MSRLSQSQVKPYRIKLLRRQEGKCALCGLPLSLEEAVLDHSHKSGYIRGVLHRGCNSMEGVITRWRAKCLLADNDKLAAYMANFVSYLERGELNPDHNPQYPNFKTAEEKRVAVNRRNRLKRAKEARAKIAATKQHKKE